MRIPSTEQINGLGHEGRLSGNCHLDCNPFGWRRWRRHLVCCPELTAPHLTEGEDETAIFRLSKGSCQAQAGWRDERIQMTLFAARPTSNKLGVVPLA